MLILSTGACRERPPLDDLLGDRARTPAPSSDGSCDFDLAAEHGDTVFFGLGMLNEYLGRGIVEGGDGVESFYCNETETAKLFHRAILKLAEERNPDPR